MCICPFVVVLQAVLKTTFKATHSFLFFFVLFSWRFAQSVVLIQHRLRPPSLVHVDEMTIACSAALLDLYNFFSLFLLQWVSWVTYARGNVMDATLRAPFCHCGSHAAAAATVPLRPPQPQPRLHSRGASGVAAAATAVTAITVQSLLAVAQRERGSF